MVLIMTTPKQTKKQSSHGHRDCDRNSNYVSFPFLVQTLQDSIGEKIDSAFKQINIPSQVQREIQKHLIQTNNPTLHLEQPSFQNNQMRSPIQHGINHPHQEDGNSEIPQDNLNQQRYTQEGAHHASPPHIAQHQFHHFQHPHQQMSFSQSLQNPQPY